MAARVEDYQRHPSYGTIVVSRPTYGGRGAALFGSSIVHSHVVRIEIAGACLRRDLSTDWIHPDGVPFVTVEMSHTQFAEMVASHSRGSGTPCTVRRVQGEQMPEPPYVHPTGQHREEFAERVRAIAAKLDEALAFANELKGKPTVSKADRDKMAEMIRFARQCVSSDLPFATRMFQEVIEKSVTEAKGEIDAHLLRLIHETGIEALRAGAVDLPIEDQRPDLIVGE